MKKKELGENWDGYLNDIHGPKNNGPYIVHDGIMIFIDDLLQVVSRIEEAVIGISIAVDLMEFF